MKIRQTKGTAVTGPTNRRATLLILGKTLFTFYPLLFPAVLVGIVFNAAVKAISPLFMQKAFALIEANWQGGTWLPVAQEITRLAVILGCFYLLSIVASLCYTRMMAYVTQGSLLRLRQQMFNRMQALPIKYFDTHPHGDIMSHYTNDIDTLRQLISQSIPQFLAAAITLFTVVLVMLYLCVWLAVVVFVAVFIMLKLTKKIGGNSARYFLRQQQALGKTEGFIEEIMNGQKVVKVFCHEKATKDQFDELNQSLYQDSRLANKYANTLGPILNNIGNLLYVVVAMAAGYLVLNRIPNISFSGLAMGISVVVPFLNMTKQFAGNINQVSHQINAVVMGMAGAERIFSLLEQTPEDDTGSVVLVNVTENQGQLVECEECTEAWAWKASAPPSYTRLQGAVFFKNVDFAYEEGKTILKHISLEARPGQKIALVGATGAGKTTITNLLNRFYDISQGRITYDGIDLQAIKKADLRRSLGIVLQDTNLFTGTVLENIRYGRLNATDAECQQAAVLSGADDFISRLPEGYGTLLTSNGSNLSQGQRQLLAIARAAVADPPVMILDEATSSIDTRTEAIVQRGMDALMQGRTVFVIAHRLSTVQNADLILVLEQGRIIERGSHSELLAQKGKYYQLYTGAFELE